MPLASLNDTLANILSGVRRISTVNISIMIECHINRVYTESTDGESIIQVLLGGSPDETSEASA